MITYNKIIYKDTRIQIIEYLCMLLFLLVRISKEILTQKKRTRDYAHNA